jgi:hypothetical protein
VADDFRFEANGDGIDDLLKIDGVRSAVLSETREILARADIATGGGHELTSRMGRKRFRASVVADSFEAKLAEAKDRNLSRALANSATGI